MKFLTFLISFLVFHISVSCQTNSDTSSFAGPFKNVIYGTLGVIPGIVYNINYERQLTSKDTDLNTISLRLGYGASGNLNGSAKMCLLSSNFIMGKEKGHLEMDLGAAYLFDIVRYESDKKTGIIPVFNIGYRFQKRNDQLVFRTGVGWPDCAYISLGLVL
jgi:hypothetical protein